MLGIVCGGAAVLLWIHDLGLDRRRELAARLDGTSPPQQAPRGASGEPAPPRCHLGVVIAKREVDVSAESAGRLVRVPVKVGDVVTRGSTLASLDQQILSHDIEAEQAALEVAVAERTLRQVQANRAEQEAHRRQGLKALLADEEIARTQSEHREAVALLASAEAEILRIRARLERTRTLLERSDVVAPFDGVVAARYLDSGATVVAGTPVVRLIDSKERRVRFVVPPERAPEFTRGTPVRVEVESLGDPDRVASTTGVVSRQAPEIDAASRKVFVEADLEGSITWPVGIRSQVSAAGVTERCF
ncbi:MAG: efflux RND transporter periplasmic adaptor subunit [Acidobacteriota bacterium]